MQVVYHLGAHCTDDDRLVKCLNRNSKKLTNEGIIAPSTGFYRSALRKTITEHRGALMDPEAQEKLLSRILKAHSDEIGRVDRLVLTVPNCLSSLRNILNEGRLYARAGEKAWWLSQVFGDSDCEFHLSIRNPATLIPAAFARCDGVSFADYMGKTDPRTLLWSDVIRDIQDMTGAPITVWCNEDTPLIWPEVLREVSGHDTFTQLKGTDSLLESIMSEEGMTRLRAYLKEHPPVNEIQRRRVVAAFLDKFALEDEVEMELDLPGWTETLVEEMTESYEEDIFEIERMSGVQFIAP